MGPVITGVWRRWLGAAAFCIGLALAAPALAQEKVTFPSRDGTPLEGYLFRANRSGPGPAVVFAHGCGGLKGKGGALNTRETAWAADLTRAGISVLMVDSFATRGIQSMCAPATFNGGVYRARSGDLYGALAYLQTQPFVKPDAVGVIGWSQGGGAVLNALRTDAGSRPAGLAPARDFRVAVAFYPGSCSAERQRGQWNTHIPLLVLLGERDVWTPLAPCQALLADAASHGSPVQVKVYPGAYHDFDWPNRPYQELPQNRTSAGVVPIIATDPAARADALSRVPAFLAQYLK